MYVFTVEKDKFQFSGNKIQRRTVVSSSGYVADWSSTQRMQASSGEILPQKEVIFIQMKIEMQLEMHCYLQYVVSCNL